MWNKRHGAALFLNSLSTGLLAPVLSLLLLGQGCSLSAIPLVVGLHSATTIAAELPSGMYADRFGRRRSFLLAQLLALPMLALLAAPGGLVTLVLAMVCYGLSRAFASGSLDALVVDEFLIRNGQEKLGACTARISMLTSMGLATGCILGGGLYALTGAFWPVLLAKGGVTLVLMALAAGLAEHCATAQPQQGQIKELARLVRAGKLLRAVLFVTVAGVPALFAVELFYQPRFAQLAGGGAVGWVLGLLAAGSYYAAAAGAALGRRVQPQPTLFGLLGATAAEAAALLVLALCRGPAGFVAAYPLFYLGIGWADYLAVTLMNGAAPPQHRAALLSANSLAVQLGGLAASPLLSAGVGLGSIPQVWALAALAAAAAMLAARLWWRRERDFLQKTGHDKTV